MNKKFKNPTKTLSTNPLVYRFIVTGLAHTPALSYSTTLTLFSYIINAYLMEVDIDVESKRYLLTTLAKLL